MANDRSMTLHFNDGTKLTFDFPEQTTSMAAKQMRMVDFNTARHVVVQTEKEIMFFPITSIKYISLSSAEPIVIKGVGLPKHAVVNARLRE